MTPSIASLTVCAFAAIGIFAVRRLVQSRSRHAPFPPGPKGLPVIGNLLDWPKEKEWETFTKWGELYGDIVHCNLVGQHIIVLNSPRLAHDVLDRKGAIYSERPHMYFGSELVGWADSVGMAPYAQRLKDIRRLISKEIGNKAAIARFVPSMERETIKFVRRVLDEPHLLRAHSKNLAGTIILSVSHGYQVADRDDRLLARADKVLREVSEALAPGAHLVDSIPALRYLPDWFPGTGYRQEAVRMRQSRQTLLDSSFSYVKEQLDAGTARPSFVASQLEARGFKPTPYELEVIKQSAEGLYAGGSDTSVAAMCTFFLAMTLYPEIQMRARREIDQVIGTERLPALSDRENLPYIEAVFKEVLRWGQILPQGLPHAALEDDTVDGYFVPKGSYILPNIWKFTHDPKTYTNPRTFDPTRFLESKERQPEADPMEFVFGFGRRACPGSTLASASVFLVCAVTLATLDIRKAVDSHGHPVEPRYEYISGGIITHLHPFEYAVNARSAKAESLVRVMEELQS